MRLTTEDIEEYQAICRKLFGMEIDSQTASQELSELMSQMRVVYSPIKIAQLRALNDRRGDLIEYLNESIKEGKKL